jgi:hypothetical protein
MEKKEGLFNKTLMVTLANGKKVAARIKASYIPCPQRYSG